MSIAEEIEKLDRLRINGTLTDEEFQAAKTRILNGEQPVNSPQNYSFDDTPDKIFGVETNAWCFLMHLSQLLNVAPGAGILVPIVMWAISKDISEEADRQGVVIINWTITFIIAALIFGVLSTLIVGIPFLIITLLLGIVYPVIGAVKALNGEFWEYPMSIHFVKYPEEIEEHRESYL